MFMTQWQYKKYLDTIKQMTEREEKLNEAVTQLLKRMYQICVEQGVLKKTSKKQLDGIYFNFRYDNQDIDEKFISLTDISLDFGDVSTENLPATWLWRKTWEFEFIKEWVEPVKADQLKWDTIGEKRERELYKKLHKKYGHKKCIKTI